nr:hypothetical protein L204_04131 [Cryptococcus depauperatus CBS 7855]
MSLDMPYNPDAGPSTLRSRRPQAQSLAFASTQHAVFRANDVAGGYSSDQQRNQLEEQQKDLHSPLTPKTATDQTSSSVSSSHAQFPGGLPLPAVKGVISSIESPRDRQGRGTASIYSTRETPGTPKTPTSHTEPSNQVQHQQLQQGGEKVADDEEQRRILTNVVFRADPTMKSAFLSLPMDKKDEIARLFGVS